MKPEFGMHNWWVEEQPDGSVILRGNISGRSNFVTGEPILNDESTYTSIVIAYDTWEHSVETVNSIYYLYEPINEMILEANLQEAESLRIQLGGKVDDGTKIWQLT